MWWHSVNCLQFNLSHHVGHLSFGMDYPGQVNPLDGTEQFADKGGWYSCNICHICCVVFNFFMSRNDISPSAGHQLMLWECNCIMWCLCLLLSFIGTNHSVSEAAACRLCSIRRRWFICWFRHYIYCLLVCILFFPYLFFPLRVDPIRFQAGRHKRRLNLALVFCVVVYFYWLVNASFCCVRFSFSIPSQEIGLGNVSEMIYFVLSWT